MGAASSRAAQRTHAHAAGTAAAGTGRASAAGGAGLGGATGAAAADAARAAQAARPAALTLAQEEALEARDVQLGGLLDRIGGAIQGRTVDVAGAKHAAGTTAAAPGTSGRLPSWAIKELFELQRAAAGGPVDASHLIAKYKADPALVRAVLARACLPELTEVEGPAGVQAFGEFPAWFERRGAAGGGSDSNSGHDGS